VEKWLITPFQRSTCSTGFSTGVCRQSAAFLPHTYAAPPVPIRQKTSKKALAATKIQGMSLRLLKHVSAVKIV
jgi:hypothetical protein